MNKFLIAFTAWFFWTVFMLWFDKDEYDDRGERFPFVAYMSKNWEKWLATLTFCIMLSTSSLLGINIEKGVMDLFNHLFSASFVWNDFFYCIGGFGLELVMRLYKAYRKKTI